MIARFSGERGAFLIPHCFKERRIMARKKTRRRRRAKSSGSAGRPRKLATVSLAELKAEIDRRHTELKQRRDSLAQELAELEHEIAGMGDSASVRRGPGRPRATSVQGPRRRGRPAGTGRRGKPSLVTTLQRVLSGRTLSVTEAVDAARKAGYKSQSANFRTIVNQALLANTNLFKKVARGQYTAK
jgi:hypothetical protein